MIINSTSYKINKWIGPANPKKDTVKKQYTIDGTQIIVNYGARQKRTSTISIINMTQAEYLALIEYLITNAGEKIAIRPENSGESIFPEQPYGTITDYYVYIIAPSGPKEEDFSITNNLWTIDITFEYAGVDNADAVPNEAGTSTIDILIKIDTINADYTQSGTPADGTYIGQRWLDTDDNKLYKWDGTDWTTFLYTVASDDSDYSFIDGVFYLSAFSDVTYGGITYKSGLINSKSIKLAGRTIDINGGPAIEKLEGFSFSINAVFNGAKFWKYLIDNNIGLFGAKCTIGIWEDGDTYTEQATGKNIKSQFTYTDYKYDVEPYILNKNDNFPDAIISTDNSRYADVQESLLGKSVYRTYGEFEYASLQNISTEKALITAERARYQSGEYSSVTSIQAQINFDNQTQIYIRKSDLADKNKYTISAADLARMDEGICSIKIAYDDKAGTQNIGEVRKITSTSETSDYYILTIAEAFTTAPDDNGGAAPATDNYITISITKYKYQFQIDDEECGGVGINYKSIFYNNLKVFGLDSTGREFVSIPCSDYIINDDKNLLLMNPLNNSDSTIVEFFTPTLPSDIYKPIKKLYFEDIAKGDLVGYEEVDFDGQTSAVDLAPAGSDTYMESTYKMAYYQGAGAVLSPFVYSSWLTMRRALWTVNNNPDGSLITNVYLPARSSFNLTEAQLMGENSVILPLRFPIVHDENDVDFISNENIKLSLTMSIKSTYLSIMFDDSFRETPQGFKILIRFKKEDNTYISNSEWLHEINAQNLGSKETTGVNFGRILINNYPDGNIDAGGFSETTTTLKENYAHQITFISVNEAAILAISGKYGDKAWNTETGKLYTFDGSSWNSPGEVVSNGVLILHRPFIAPIESNTKIYKVTAGTPQTLVEATDGTDYDSLPEYHGRDIFDLSLSNVFGSSAQWSEIESLEILIVNLDLANQFNAYDEATSVVYTRFWKTEIEMISGPTLMVSEEIETIDRPLFTPCLGRVLNGDYSNAPYDIITDIMNSSGMYANQWNSSTLDESTGILSYASRSGWKWRRQFTEAMKSEDVLLEILHNLWASAIIDTNGKLSFKSMNPGDYSSSTRTFNDSNILEDSFSPPRFRRINEIFTEFHLDWNYNIASEFSKAMREYNGNTILDSANGSTRIKRYIEISEAINNIKNTYKMGYKYHYESLPIAEWVADWFVLNVWQFEFKVSINEIISGNSLNLMDFINVNSSYFTDGEDVNGFVTTIKPDYYNGEVLVGVHVYRPPGVFGVLCDNFNDAKTTGRSIATWTDANGKLNDAGTTGRTIGDYTIKDAGTTGRDLSC